MNETMDARMRWKKRAEESAKACCQALISSRVELSLVRISQDPEYKKLYQQQEAEEKQSRMILKKLTEDEQEVILHYQEQMVEKQRLEADAAYIQGIRDCLHLLAELDLFCGGRIDKPLKRKM